MEMPTERVVQLQMRLAQNPKDAEALLGLGVALCQTGDWSGLEMMQRAADLRPHLWRYPYMIGAMQEERGEIGLAIMHTRRSVELNPGGVDGWFALGLLCAKAGEKEEALEAYRRVLALEPMHPGAMKALDAVFGRQVKAWHFSMMNDLPRNDAFEKGIEAQVRGKLVLEIGAGSGLLSMMAARAGAKHVYACEMVPEIAAKAREIIAQNGWAEKITVLGMSSFDLKLEELPERAEVLITETFDARLIGEQVVPIVADAKARLLTPGAVIIPARASVMAMLVESEAVYGQVRVGQVNGFDLSAFNEFTVRPGVALTLQNYDFVPLSEAVEAVRIDFAGDALAPQDYRFSVPVTRGGVNHALASWIRLELAPGVIYECSPLEGGMRPKLHWLHWVQCWDEPRAVRAGDVLEVEARYAGKQFVFSVV